MHTIEVLRKIEVGAVCATVRMVSDECEPDVSYLGEFSRMDWDPESYIYHRDSGLMFDGSLWRDRQGRIAAEPDMSGDRYGREFPCIDIGTCQFRRGEKHSLKYAFQNADRLESLNNGNWGMVGIVADVEVEGIELGHASCFGIESDSETSYFAEVGRDLLNEAISDARDASGKVCRFAA